MSESSLEQSSEKLQAEIYRLEAFDMILPSNFNIHFHFSAHKTKEDMGDADLVGSLVKQSDIVIPEELSWDSRVLKMYKRISSGGYKEYCQLRDVFNQQGEHFAAEQLRAIYSTRKVITYVDVGRENPFYKDVKLLMNSAIGEEAADDESVELSPINPTSFDEHIDHTIAVNKTFLTANQYRERLIMHRLGTSILELVEQHPKLSKKQDINILMFMGATHTSLFHAARAAAKDGQPVTRTFGERNITFGASHELLRAGLMGIELTRDLERKLVVKSLAEKIINITGDVFDLWQDLTRYQIRSLSSRLSNEVSEDEVREWDGWLFEFATAKEGKMPVGENIGEQIVNRIRQVIVANNRDVV